MSEIQEKMFVGKTVHYVSYGTPGGEYQSECRAAIVTGIPAVLTQYGDEPSLSIAVLNPGGLFFNTTRHGEPNEGGTWHHISECPNIEGN